MFKNKKNAVNMAEQAGTLFGNAMSMNAQSGTDMAVETMGELLYKSGRLSNVGFEQSKGNLFEYIEAAKLQTNMANKGHFFDKNPVTDIPESRGGFGEHTAPDDFRMVKNGKVIGRGQAKYNNQEIKAARNIANRKYEDMQRVVPIDQVNEIKQHLDKLLENGEISRNDYNNVVENLQYNGLTDPYSGISSGGTTKAEIENLRGKDGKISQEAVKKYVMQFEGKQLLREVGTTSANMAASSAITTGIVSGVRNMFAVFQDEKELKSALKDVGVDMAKGAAKGAGTGTLSTLIRFGGVKSNVSILSDSTAATVMAGGIIDGGVALYEYARGDISAEQLQKELVNTTVKSVTTIYFTKAVAAVAGAANPFIPMAIYTVSSYVVSCVRSIIEEAKLNAKEYDRMTALLEENTRLMKEYHEQLNEFMKNYESSQRQMLQGFLNSFDYCTQTGDNYERAIYSIVNFANQTGIALQYANFNEFESAMKSDMDFVLK